MNDPVEKIKKEKERLIKAEKERQEALAPPAEETVPEVKDEETEPAPVETVPEVPAVVDTPPEEETYKSRYQTLLGKYNAEVPRLHDEVRNLKEQLNTIAAQLESQGATPAKPTAPEVDEEGNPIYRSPYVTDAMRQEDNYKWLASEYGITGAERQYESNIVTSKYTSEQVQKELGEVRAETAEDKFQMRLDREHPTWSVTNSDPEFIAWLQNKAPGTGKTWHELLRTAYYSWNLADTVEIFALYESTKIQPAAEPPIKPTVPEHLVAPDRKGGGTQTVVDNNQGKVLRMADMRKLYEDYRQGLYQGKEAEYQKLKGEYMKAKAEGRLI